ncbi:hypothetical protein MVEN_00136100 [Mycena venus]|uniref:Uncharacterized protein n=1 Tax=Mycena venus TaxID=2733690 RepID=A0A8H7DE34_9AGAR|nr:hypothetical protein MVEN_00136100 [Mycena venus]
MLQAGPVVQALKDIGVDILAFGSSDESEPPFDYEGVDFLAMQILTGVLGWFNKLDRDYWDRQPWYESFTELVQLLRKPRAAELLPHSSACASSSFEDVIPTFHENAELKLMVDHENKTTDTPDKNRDDSLLELDYEDDSTTSVHSAMSDQDDKQLPDSMQDDENEPQYPDPDINSLSASQSILSNSD